MAPIILLHHLLYIEMAIIKTDSSAIMITKPKM